MFVVRNAPDPVRSQAARPNLALKQRREHLLAYVGAIAPQDSVDHGLRALALLRERRTDWRAVFLGSGDALPEMKRLAVELGLQDHVEFAGWAGDECVGEVLATADVGLAPDPRSPLNDASTMIKVAEYMSMALPLVAFDLPESVVTAEGAALFAAGNDEAEFADRVDDLLNDPELRARLGTAGQARMAGPLSWSASEGAVARSVSTDPRQLTPLRRTSQIGLRAAFGRSGPISTGADQTDVRMASQSGSTLGGTVMLLLGS